MGRKGEAIQLQGSLNIGRDSENTIRLTVDDKTAGIEFLSIQMTPEQFALAITGRGFVQVPVTVRGLDLIGKKQEVKRELVDGIAWNNTNFQESFRKAVEPYEVDGWIADTERGHNHHKVMQDGKYEVLFRRYVDIE